MVGTFPLVYGSIYEILLCYASIYIEKHDQFIVKKTLVSK